MPEFILHRNYILRTTKGHIIGFKAGKPTNVPTICVEDVVAIGAVPVNAGDGDVLGEEEKVEQPLNAEERKAKVFEAFDTMKARGERNDFTGNGLPDNRRLPALLGFEITAKERDTYWQTYRELEQEALEQKKLDLEATA